jgi:hypothetical protein
MTSEGPSLNTNSSGPDTAIPNSGPALTTLPGQTAIQPPNTGPQPPNTGPQPPNTGEPLNSGQPPSAGPSMSNRPRDPGAPPDSGPGNRPPWHRPPYPPPAGQPPWWWWQVPTDTDDDWEPTCQGSLLPANAPAPPPFQYLDQTVTPLFDSNLQQWGFWFGGKWIPLYESGC